jgi:hypothetical protein
MDAIDSLLGHIEEIKETLPDATYMSMLENLQTLHRKIRKPSEVPELLISMEQMHIGDEYLYNLIRNIVGRRDMNAGHLCQILRRKGYSPQFMGYENFKEWMEDLHIHIENNIIVFP